MFLLPQIRYKTDLNAITTEKENIKMHLFTDNISALKKNPLEILKNHSEIAINKAE